MLDYDTLAELADMYKEKYNRLLETNNRLEEMLDEANEKIEQLHKKIAYLTEQAERWEDDALRLMKERNIEIEQLRKERDEARREVCECKCSPPKTPFFGAPQELAEVNGWDCFKDHK